MPPLLPAHLRPPMTPPISSPCPVPTSAIGGYGSAGFWAQFGKPASDQQSTAAKPVSIAEQFQTIIDVSTAASSFGMATTAAAIDPQNALSPAPVVLKEFTNVPPPADFMARPNMAQPKPRRVTPEAVGQNTQQSATLGRPTTSTQHSSSAPPSASKFSAAPLPAPRPRTSTNDSILTNNNKAGSKSPSQAVTSPQTGPPPAAVPKGPPPKPPPRPTASAAGGASGGHRHSRSVSLDLSKKMTDMQHQFATANINYQSGAPVQEFVSPLSAVEIPVSTCPTVSEEKRETRDAQVQTSKDQFHDGADEAQRSGNNAKRNSTAPMLDLSMDIGDETPRAPGDGPTPPLKQPSSMNTSTAGTDAVGVDDSKDWTKRCERLRRMNAELERDLKKLSEVRVGLEMHFKRLEKL